MSCTDDGGAGFAAPGPGSWTLDTIRFPRPATHFVIEVFPAPARRGFEEATARYGLLLDHIQWAFVHRWAYLSPRPVSPLRERMPGTRQDWDELVGTTPALGERLAASARVFEQRSWREEVRRWDGQVRPALSRGHLALQAVEPVGLTDDELAAHVGRCRDNLSEAVYQHHVLNVAPVLPAGDLLVRTREWTGRPAGELIGLVRGGGLRAGPAADRLARLAVTLQRDREARDVLTGDHEPDPEVVLSALVDRSGEVGQAVSGYLDVVGHWSAGGGTDITQPRLLEMPGVLVEMIRAAVEGGGSESGAGRQLAEEVRAEVPAADRAAFDRLLAEARSSHRVREERALYCDVWAYGLARRAVLAAGRRLTETGALEAPEHLVEADPMEMDTLIRSGAGPSAGELAVRARYRNQASQDDAPEALGDPVGSPVPTEWLPPGPARTERAFRTYVAAMSGDPQASGDRATVRGVAASPGRCRGRARVVSDPAQLALVERGEVLVTAATTPAFQVVLSVVGALVTDRGGQLSHAAIVAREFGIPAVVGTGDATARIADGALVEVDGDAGEVRVAVGAG